MEYIAGGKLTDVCNMELEEKQIAIIIREVWSTGKIIPLGLL